MMHILDRRDVFKKQIKAHQVALFLDYDGTLTPIADRPEQAVLSPRMRQVLNSLVQDKRLHVFIVSGRSMADIKKLVGINNIVYIGNHGFEIEGAEISFEDFSFLRFREILEYLKWEINKELTSFEGAFVEDKGLGLSVHFRMLNLKDESIFKTYLGVITREFVSRGEISVTHGKKVFEIRAPLDWDKGKAVIWILEKYQFAQGKQKVVPVYIGDDKTDEDAFLALKDKGITIHVGHAQHSHAQYYLNDTDEVIEFLEHCVR